MRASEVRYAIVTRLTATTLDDKARGRDKFVEIRNGTRDIPSAPDRHFLLVLTGQPARHENQTCDWYTVAYRLRVFYAETQPGIEDRMAADAERLYARLERLHEVDADIFQADIVPAGVGSADINLVASEWDLTITFRLDSAVATGA